MTVTEIEVSMYSWIIKSSVEDRYDSIMNSSYIKEVTYNDNQDILNVELKEYNDDKTGKYVYVISRDVTLLGYNGKVVNNNIIIPKLKTLGDDLLIKIRNPQIADFSLVKDEIEVYNGPVLVNQCLWLTKGEQYYNINYEYIKQNDNENRQIIMKPEYKYYIIESDVSLNKISDIDDLIIKRLYIAPGLLNINLKYVSYINVSSITDLHSP